MLQKGSLNYLAKEVFLPKMLFSHSLNLSTSQLFVFDRNNWYWDKKNVSKTRGIAESKYTFNRVSFLYSVPQTCYIAPSCQILRYESIDCGISSYPPVISYPHILLFKSLKSTEFLNLEEIFDTSYVLLVAYTLKARKYYYLHHKHL